MSKTNSVTMSDIYAITGPEIRKRYVDNKMSVHFQGMSKTLQFPHTIALMGAPTCSVGISPEGLYNRLNDAGRLILLNHNGVQLGSAPFVRVADKTFMLTTRNPQAVEKALANKPWVAQALLLVPLEREPATDRTR